jgi:hypothetical protein
MREGPVVLLNTFLTSSKARGEQLDDLRRRLMVERSGEFYVSATRRKRKGKMGERDRR